MGLGATYPAPNSASCRHLLIYCSSLVKIIILLHKIIKFALMTTEQCYNDFLRKLTSIYDSREAANITDWVFEYTTGLKRWERIGNKSVALEEGIFQELEKYLYELLQHKPVQYVLHEAWFYKMKFYVNEYVLIPRPETEELVEWIIEDARNSKNKVQNEGFKILDVGTGSGCIAISIKKELTNANVTALDV